MAITKAKIKNVAVPGSPLSQSEFSQLIAEGEKGSFKAVGTFEEFKKDVMASWQKRHQSK